jgi:hypothetical protein
MNENFQPMVSPELTGNIVNTIAQVETRQKSSKAPEIPARKTTSFGALPPKNLPRPEGKLINT